MSARRKSNDRFLVEGDTLMAIAICDHCDTWIDLDYIDGYSEDDELCLCAPCRDTEIERREEENADEQG